MTGTSASSEFPPEVHTTGGVLRGKWDVELGVFLGIRYAQPPVGLLRFAEPRKAHSWDGVRPAIAYGPPPPQPGLDRSPDTRSDDWLTVNVWSPDLGTGSGLPVLVWIPGGGYVIGASNLPEFDGARLAAGGVVVVTLNYRLGIEGFARIDGAPANRGLLDQIAALEWVRDNIRNFGGDPDRVTIFGESAGGGSVAALLAMPRAAGLFHRAIAQSVPGTFFAPELASDVAAACAAELGLKPTVYDLSTIDPDLLPEAGVVISENIQRWKHRWGPITHRPIPFAPVVDGDILPTTPWQALANGVSRDVDLIVGHTRDEHRLFSMIDGVLGQVTEAQSDAALGALAPGADGALEYREAFPTAGPEELYELVNSDWLFRMPSLHLAQAHAVAGGRTYVYELTWQAPAMGGSLGACHGLDVPLVFGNLGSGAPAMLIGRTPSTEAEQLSAWIRTAWIAFAATGDPGWPLYDAEQRLVQLLETNRTVAVYPEETSRRLWETHTFGALPLVGS